ncbi:MAG: hypothetical protein HYS18_11020 [Burkholderiales bacterium]|nr:hypothetical protein [Burkholderiales bacterium]
MLELIFELIFEFFGEAILQVLFEALAEVGIHLSRNTDGEPKERGTFKKLLGYTLLGVIAGGISLLIVPESFARTQPARLAMLFLVPAASGAVMVLIGKWRQKRGQVVIGLDRFFFGYWFAFSMAAVRFIGTN